MRFQASLVAPFLLRLPVCAAAEIVLWMNIELHRRYFVAVRCR